ncbi:MAG: heme lyase CcmF/NrfE family subunit [Anaerolineae bacterium]|nr:heme lyase CcmF/NrfE family subunit [Anaerolineae bacterium]
MLAELGIITTAVALLLAWYAVLASVWGAQSGSERWVYSARNAALLTWPLLTTACAAMIISQVNGDFHIEYVWATTERSSDLFFKLTALWGGQAGSLLFWSWVLSTFSGAALLWNWRSERRLMPYVIAFTMGTLGFFLILNVIIENPFTRLWQYPNGQVETALFQPAGAMPAIPRDGRGLNPLLRHPGMVFHPPTLYLGYVGMVIPWAFAMAALASGELSTHWIRATRRWILVAWLFLSLGLILGGRWAYDVLGWGGYWGWDPVENAALLPWLTGTAFLHSVMIQEKRGMLKVWNMALIILTFLLVILGTFSTRSGIVSSVHSFAQSPIGPPMFAFLAISALLSIGLWLYRWQRGELAAEHHLESWLSRESLFILNNLLFVAITVAVFWGSYAPIFTELFTGEKITLGPPYFNSVTAPLFAALYVLMGIAPLSAWGRTSTKRLGSAMLIPLLLTAALVILLVVFGMRNWMAILAYALVGFAGFVTLYEIWRGVKARAQRESWLVAAYRLFGRNRRRYGGYVIHLGVVVIGLGVIGSTIFQQETQRTLAEGEALTLGRYTMVYDQLTRAVAADGRVMTIAEVEVYDGNQLVATLRPRQDFFPNTEGMNTMTIAGSYSTLESDFYVLLVAWEEISQAGATFKVYLNPLVNLVWWGGIILIVGIMVAAWPEPDRLRAVREMSTVGSGTTSLRV